MELNERAVAGRSADGEDSSIHRFERPLCIRGIFLGDQSPIVLPSRAAGPATLREHGDTCQKRDDRLGQDRRRPYCEHVKDAG